MHYTLHCCLTWPQGRAGRRGLDTQGNIVYAGIRASLARRLMVGKITNITGRPFEEFLGPKDLRHPDLTPINLSAHCLRSVEAASNGSSIYPRYETMSLQMVLSPRHGASLPP